jgi:hypothetical protein
VRVKTEEMPSLYERFASARAQVGVYSTALYEGIGFGLPTYLLDTSGVEYMEELIGANYATLIRGAEELVEALDQESRSVPPIDRFFRRDSLERVPRLIEELAGGS